MYTIPFCNLPDHQKRIFLILLNQEINYLFPKLGLSTSKAQKYSFLLFASEPYWGKQGWQNCTLSSLLEALKNIQSFGSSAQDYAKLCFPPINCYETIF